MRSAAIALILFVLSTAASVRAQSGSTALALERSGAVSGDFVALPFVSKPNNLTISAWIKLSDRTIGAPAVTGSIMAWSQGGNPFSEFRVYDGYLGWIERPYGPPFGVIQSPSIVAPCVWTHVAVTRNLVGGTWTIKLFINGVLDTTGSTTVSAVGQNTLTLGGNRRFGGLGAPFDGSMQQVSFWNTALSDAAIPGLMSGIDNTHPNYANLVSYWQMNEGSGQIVADSKGSNHGTLGASTGVGGDDPMWVDTSFTLCSDVVPPAIMITGPVDGLVTNAPSVTVTATVTDDGATTVTSTPSGASPGTLPAGGGSVTGSVVLADEGVNLITISATDEAGNPSATSIDVYRDTAAPIVTIAPDEGTIVGTPIPSFGISVSDQTLTSVSIDGVPQDPATVEDDAVYGVSSVTLTGSIPLWHEGPNSIVVTAIDAGGNATTLTRTVILDSTAPVVEITTPENGACYGSGSATVIPLAVDINDATATDITGDLIDSLPAGGGTLTGTFALQEGVNTISVTATNPGVGLSATDTVTVTLDTIAPTVQITSPGDQACVRGSIEFHALATDVLPGAVAASTHSVDGVALPAAELYLVDTTLLADGPHVLRVDATDTCGNESSASITIHVDNTAPTLTITDPIDLAWVAGTIGFGASAEDAGTGLVAITMRAADTAPTTDGSQEYMTPVASGFASSLVDTLAASGGLDGDLELEVTARDCAGNETTVAVTVHVDNSAPQKAITSPADGAIVRCLLDVQATVDDPNLASVQFVIDGVASPLMTTAPFRVPFDTRDRLDGEMQITLIATDLSDNISTCTITVTVDNLEVEVHPETLELKSRGRDKSVTVEIEGQSAHLLFGAQPSDITLCIPGGSPISATSISGFHLGWRCNRVHESSHRGHRKGHERRCHGRESELKVKFDRQLLIGALRGAGITDGKVEMTIKVTQGGVTYEIGSDKVRVRNHR